MQEALESIFGPGVGLIGFLVMFLMFLPKILRRWRGAKARKNNPAENRPRITGQRALILEADEKIKALASHTVHGEPLTMYKTNMAFVLLETVCWFLPLIIVLCFVPAGLHSMRTILFVGTIPIACIGLFTLSHIRDRLIFYKTGAEFRIAFKTHSVDYNSIYSMTERKSMLPFSAPSYLLHMDDDKLIVLNGAYLKEGRTVKTVLKKLDARVISSASEEKMHTM